MNFNISKVKISVTVPLENLDEVRTSMSEAGAGSIGEYSCCSISTKCVGTFKGSDQTNPYIGTKNE